MPVPTPTGEEGSTGAGNRTLQLRLSLSSSNTSFKRSFEELFGGAESDGSEENHGDGVGGHESDGIGAVGSVRRDGRNKRQRSGDCVVGQSSAGGSAGGASSSAAAALTVSLPPRLPTPRLEDVHMADIPLLDHPVATGTSREDVAGPSEEGSGLRSGVLQIQQSSRSATSSFSQHAVVDATLDSLSLENQYATTASMPSGALSLRSNSPPPLLPPVIPGTPPTPVRPLSPLVNPSPRTSPSLVLAPLSLSTSSTTDTEERYRVTMERYNTFESNMAALRRSVSPPPPRSILNTIGVGVNRAASPPRLPPLELSSLRDDEDHGGDEDHDETHGSSGTDALGNLPRLANNGSIAHVHVRPDLSAGRHRHMSLGESLAVDDESLNDMEDEEDDDEDDEDEELDELDQLDEEDEDRGSNLYQHHQHLRHHDAPPRIELSNSLWSSLSTGVGVGGEDQDDDPGDTDDEGGAGARTDNNNPNNRGYPDPPPFRDRLDSALEALRSPSSPLVPGLVPGNRDRSLNNENSNESNRGNEEEEDVEAEAEVEAELLTASRSGVSIASTSSLQNTTVNITTVDHSTNGTTGNNNGNTTTLTHPLRMVYTSHTTTSSPASTNTSTNTSTLTSTSASASSSSSSISGGMNTRTAGTPPTLPPIVTDTDTDEMWRRDLHREPRNVHVHVQTQIQVQPQASTHHHLHQVHFHPRTTTMHTQHVHHHHHHHNHAHVGGDVDSGDTGRFSFASASVHAHERRAMQMQQQQQQQQQQRQRLGLGEVEVPSPSLSGFYDWLEGASANVADANGHGNTGNSDVGLGSRQSGSGSGNGSGSGSGNGNGIWALAMGARERTGIGEERRSLEDALAGWLRNDREIDPELPLRERDTIPASSRPGSGFSATATRPTDENVGMDVDMESDTEREREVERLPWTLGSSTTSSASRSNHHRPPPLNLNLSSDHEVRRSQRSMPEEYRRLNLLHDTDDGEWNPLHAPVPWQAEPTFGRTSAPSPRSEFPSGSASFSRPSPRPPYSSNLFSPSSPGLPPPTPTFPSLSGRLSSTTAFDSHTPAPRIRLPRFMSSAFPENRGPRGSLPPSLELDLGLNNSVFGEDGEGAGGAGIDVAMSNNNDNNSNNNTMAAASQFGVGSGGSSYSRREPSMRLFERPELPPLPPSQSHSQQARNHFQHTHRNPNLDVDDRRRDWRAAAYGGRRDGERSRERETQRQPRYHTTRVNVVGSSNSLVAENAAEMDRRLARADLVRRLSASRRVSGGEEASSSSESGSGSNNESVEGRGTNVNVGPGSGLSGPGVSVPRVEGAGIGPAWERVARLRREAERLGRREGGEESGRSHGPLGARPRTPSQTHTTAQSGIQTRFGHLLSRSHGPSNRGAAGGGGGRGGAAASYGTFGGLGLPPRVGNGSNGGSEMRGSGSESNDDVGSSGTGASMYPGVAPPAPRPRLHSTRHMPSLSSLESAGPDHTLDGHRRSTSWSQGSLNGNPNADADSGGTRSMSTQEDIATMFGLRLPLDGSSHTQSSTRLYPHSDSESGSGPVVEEQAQRRTRTSFDSVSSSDSSMSVESLLGSGSGNSNASVYGSGSTPAPSYGRAMFLNPELPSPGLGGLFDTPGSGPGAASQQSDPSLEPLEYPPPGAPSRLASSLTFNSSNSSGFFSSVGRFTPSPVRSSDDDAEDGFVNETMSLESMMDRFGSAREGVLNLPRHVRNRDGYYEGPLDEMDIDGDQRDRGSSTTTDFPGRLATERPPIRDLRRQDLFPPAPRPSAISTSNTGSSNASSTSSDRRNNIIDPNLFAPGPFRNTMATLALRTREYTAQASSPIAAARPGTTIPSPITPFSPSSSLSPPPTYRFARPIQRGTATQGSGSGSAHSHSPPVIPPLSFENDTANQNQNGNESESNTASSSGERSEVQEPLGAVTRRWVRETGEIANNPRFADALRQYYEERRRRGRPEQSNESLGSEDSSVGSPSSVESRSASWLHLQATRREMAERVERRRALEGLPEWDALAPRQAHQNSSANTSTSANANASASAGDRPNPRLPNTNWHEVVWNPAIVGDGWVDTESDSDDDSIDFMLFGSNEGGVGSRTEMEPVPPAVPRGPREAWRLDGTTGPRRNRFQNNNSNNDTGGGSGNGTSAAGRARTGPGTEERGSGRPALMPRLFRERMIDRLRANAAAVAAGAPMGMTGRFGGFTRRTGELGDYVNDDEFDTSYESLLRLQAALGEVKPRSTPEAVLKRLQRAKYREWAAEGTDPRCPICLEDYEPDDDVLKMGNCVHWQHKACLEKWLEKANTCPVCRADVEPRQARCPRHRSFPFRRDGPGPGPSGSGSGSGGGSGGGNTDGPSSSNFSPRFSGGGPFF